tara:strand:- start:1545 stop:2246 length:702 start_codon:yes stop_codon:yes gene_type:complete
MKRYSRMVSETINNADKKFFDLNGHKSFHGVKQLAESNYKKFRDYFLHHFKAHLEPLVTMKNQNIFPVSELISDDKLLKTFKEYVLKLRQELQLPDLVQNAYFIKDISDVRAPAHEFHRDGIGVRFKVWFILDCDGSMGLEYIPTEFDPSREYAMYKSVYIPEDIKKSNVIRQMAEPGQLYCMDTECVHRGYMGNKGSRTAFVVEFIDSEKFNAVEGKYDAFHGDQRLIELMK